jgi:hypothetical protein
MRYRALGSSDLLVSEISLGSWLTYAGGVAFEQAAHGVRARVVERDLEPHRETRATAIQPAMLELLQQAGVLDRVLAVSVPVPFARLFDAQLRPTAEMEFGTVACEWPFQCSLPQWQTERILTERLLELGGTVEHGIEATAADLRDDHVLVTLERPPLPGERWINFIGDLDPDEVERLTTDASLEAVAAAFARRVGEAFRLEDVAWASVFRMHNRVFAPERHEAARHMLEVSDQLHRAFRGAIEAARSGIAGEPPSPETARALLEARMMLDVSYAGSPIVGEHLGPGGDPACAPDPGARYPGRTSLEGTAHHVLLDGPVDGAGVDRLRDRWQGVVDIVAAHSAALRDDRRPASAILIRPDGHVGFRASPANAAGLGALDADLESYLVPV